MLTTYSKQNHTFVEDGETINAIVYGGLSHPTDLYGNIHIIDLGEGEKDGRYILNIGNEGWQSDNLPELEVHLFAWMKDEGYEETTK